MLEQPLLMSSALRAIARSLGFLMGYIGPLCTRGSLHLTVTLANPNRFLYLWIIFIMKKILHATVVKRTT